MLRRFLHSESFKARLSRRIVYWVFLSIIVIEAIILVPSVYRRERELLDYLKNISTAYASGLLEGQPATDDGDALLQRLAPLQQNAVVLGGALYRADGTLVGTFGEPPELRWQAGGATQQYRRWDSRYDALWDMATLPPDYRLVIRHNASWVKREFFNFIGRITGLVIIISVFVTGATMLVLERILIKPVLKLRRDLLQAGEAIRNDDETKQMEFSSLHQARNDELGDVITAFSTMFSQITEAIATRKQSEARFMALVEQAVDAFFVVDRNGRIVDVNQQACDSLGYSRDQLQQLTVMDIQQEITAEDFARVWASLRPQVPVSREGVHRRRDGTLFPVEVRIGRLEGRTESQELILALARDVSERKQAEQAQARLAEIGELAAMIVHEVRSPLTTVLLGLQALSQLQLTERNQRRLSLALEESERLQHLLDEILQYARQQVLQLDECDLNALAQTWRDWLQGLPVAEAHSVKLQTDAAPLPILGDVNKLKQVFINLISNACEASPASEPVLWQLAAAEKQVVITVRNGGDPIPPDLLPRLTQPFFTTKTSGNGLGLAITKSIIEAHQGSLEITSNAREGTTVTVTLPRLLR